MNMTGWESLWQNMHIIKVQVQCLYDYHIHQNITQGYFSSQLPYIQNTLAIEIFYKKTY